MTPLLHHGRFGFVHLAVLAVCICFGNSGIAQDQAAPAQPASKEVPSAATKADAPQATPAVADSAATSTPSAAKPPVAEPQIPIELQPYKVAVFFSFPADPEFTPEFRDQIHHEFVREVSNTLGELWSTTLEDDQAWTTQSVEQLEHYSDQQWNERFLNMGFDKVQILVFGRTGTCYFVAGREWDLLTQNLGGTFRQTTCDRRLLAETAFAVAHSQFRPVVLVESAKGDVIEMRVRGGDFLTADINAVPFQEGDFLTPHLRYYDRQRNLKQIQDIPWTYIQIDSARRGRALGHAVSAFRSPLGGSRRRVDMVGIRVRPWAQQTRLQLVPRNNPARPLAALDVDVYNVLPTKQQPTPPKLSLMTDRAGVLKLPVDPEQDLRWLFIKSGSLVLAKVPYVPGSVESARLELPDDAPRLSAEGELSILQGEIVDAVARRTVLMAQAKSLSGTTDNMERVDQILKKIDAIPTAESFESQITVIRVPAVEAAKKSRDRVAESRINRMCGELSDLLRIHLDPEKIQSLKEEVDAIRKVAKPAKSNQKKQ